MNKIVYALPLLAATAVLAACTSSSSTSSWHSPTPGP